MPNILFASNNIAHWPFSYSSTEAGTFDPTRVPYSFVLTHEQSMTSPKFVPATGDVTWIHFRTHMDSDDYSESYPFMSAFDINGNLLWRMNSNSFSYDYAIVGTLYDGTTTEGFGQNILFNAGYINGVDVKYTVNAGSISLEYYVNGGLAGSASFAANPNSYGAPAYFTVGSAFANGPGSQYFSEFIVADGDTRNARLNLLRPIASGGETDWVGLALQLADNDPTSGMSTIAPEERQTVDLSDYTGANNISALVIATLSLAGANGPQNLRHTVRMSAVNYDSPADLPMGDTLGYSITHFGINPATSLPWVGSDLATMEMGFISKA